MKARFRQWMGQLGESFWLLPGAMVLAGVLLAEALVALDRSGALPDWLVRSSWLYNGGGTGARILLGAVASSTIGVAGTVFSITIAALSLAAGQMGPRLLTNFTRDRGNQFTLGAFLGTFSYALMVLRTVRTQEEGLFTPHLSLSVALLLAFGCVATLVYFVGHMASRISVDTVVNLVSGDVRQAMRALVVEQPNLDPPDEDFWAGAVAVVDCRRGYLQQLDEDALANWAAENGTALRLLIRRGDYLFPGAPIALMTAGVAGAEAAIRRNTALGPSRGSNGDTEQTVRQLVEVAVRALSPGINDPHSAMSVLDRLGDALCDLAGKVIPNGVHEVNGKIALVVPNVSYRSLCDVMFHLIRQNSEGSTALLMKMVEVLAVAAACEPDAKRLDVLAAHVARIGEDAQRTVGNALDLADIQSRLVHFARIRSARQEGNVTANALLGTAAYA
ncbi:MAG: DUF2254 domain-containing protein [Pseudoxanthomonas sp.]